MKLKTKDYLFALSMGGFAVLATAIISLFICDPEVRTYLFCVIIISSVIALTFPIYYIIHKHKIEDKENKK